MALHHLGGHHRWHPGELHTAMAVALVVLLLLWLMLFALGPVGALAL